MTKVIINRFDKGMADDYSHGGEGEFSISKQFDILSYPRRLQPLRGMTAATADIADITNSKIGNIIVGATGLMYGVGCDSPGNPTLGELWYKPGYGASDTWRSIPTNAQLSGAVPKYPFLVHYPGGYSARKMYWASTNLIVASDPAGASSAATHALTFTNIGQGFVHPKDDVLYIPYDNKIATVVGTSAEAPNAAVWTFGSEYQIPCLTNYGNYLAIPAFSNLGGKANTSIVYLHDRDTSLTKANETINWGEGRLQVLNNLHGALVGVSSFSSSYNGSIQDFDAVYVKVWEGGAEPTIIKEIKATRLTSTAPSVTVNPIVNFIYKDRLYFSVNIVNGGTAPSYIGLWSVGKSKLTGDWAVTIERMATNTSTETGVLAAAMAGDFLAVVHTAVGNVAETVNGNALSGIYTATSVYESTVNPNMVESDRAIKKQLNSVWCSYLPLPTDASVTMQYRVDGSLNTAWTDIFTETGNGVTFTERTKTVSAEFTSGRKYEFRITSDDGAIITDWGYNYKPLETTI